MEDAWELFEEALGQSGDRRLEELQAVIRRALDSAEVAAPDRLELVAVAKAELARGGALGLDDARDAVGDAESAGKAGWPDYYLAEAASTLGHPDTVISCLARVPPGFFESRDLNWRAIRCFELEAMARIDVGEWQHAERLIDGLVAAYASRGEADDLAPPRDLVGKLLTEMPRGCRALETIDASLDLAVWLGPDLATAAHAAIAQHHEGA